MRSTPGRQGHAFAGLYRRSCPKDTAHYTRVAGQDLPSAQCNYRALSGGDVASVAGDQAELMRRGRDLRRRRELRWARCKLRWAHHIRKIENNAVVAALSVRPRFIQDQWIKLKFFSGSAR
jgi:hypothetical protein